ncbi:proton-conducting transporter membrane subunit [Lacisediminihabitans profunda]|uniref:Hydrogenase n=1 Tax=Lacisediminihabitans profunda TaxID=2594790 RepID=A0A5C8UN57_9MICO|nr:proton-conducting transporter membrane subunit [Lacisediminihabitans profunda]TXN28930.1 hydrogenase [Lacisediminihabitans profunda]
MFIILLVPVAVPLLLGAVALVRAASWVRRFSGVVSSVAILGSGIVAVVLGQGSAPLSSAGILRADALSAYMLAVVGAVGLVATWGGLAPRADAPVHTEAGRAPLGMYAALVCIFLSAMSLAVLADNLGVMWVAIEATTIATAFLVGHNRTRRSLEAAWKYVILAPAGVAIAFLGIVLIYASSTGTPTPTLSWLALTQMSLHLDPALVRVGAALAALGFATKAGLAPMHSWLPDAHSQAPAPVSALMSGVLLSVALYAILRIQAVANAVIGPDFLRALLVAGSLLSLAIAAALLLRQRDYKRMLAYSSIEHMGVMALGAAVGPTALPAVLLYILSHGLIKASLFILAGRLLTAEGTPIISDVRSLLARRPGLAVPWLIGIVALLGFPPFGIFFSEVGIILAGWATGMGVVMSVALALMLVIFAGMTRLTVGMMFGSADLPAPRVDSVLDRSPHGPIAPLALALGACAIIPFLSGPIGTVLSDAAVALSWTP